jgi:hypothetical protein
MVADVFGVAVGESRAAEDRASGRLQSRIEGDGWWTCHIAAAIAAVVVLGLLSSPGVARGAEPTIEAEVVRDVSANSATLQAQINPGGLDTKYHFEYGPSPSFGTSVPVPDGSAGSGTTGAVVGVHIQALLQNTVYDYRLVATNASGPTVGAIQSFATQPAVNGFALPDGRAWELVSPPNKYGARVEPITNEGGVIEASEDGRAITYVTNAPIVANPPGNSSLQVTQIVSTRSSAGWSSQDIATPAESADGVFVGSLAEYFWFSPDLSLGLVEPKGATPLTPEASEKTMYLYRGGQEVPYSPLVTAANVEPGTKFGYHVHFVSATPDLGHVVLLSDISLIPPTVEGLSLYEWAEGHLQLVNVLPNGEPASKLLSLRLGDNNGDVRHAISTDGQRVVWWAFSEAGATHLYMRDMARRETVQIDSVEPGGEVGEGEPRFQTASADGSRVFFTDTQRLTADSTASNTEGNGKSDLYMFVASSGGGPLAGKLTDLTVDHNPGEHAGVQGVVPGASEDGSYVYFVAQGIVSSAHNAQNETAVAGAHNLYVIHEHAGAWDTTFVARLSEEDLPDWELGPKAELNRLTARASPSGRYFAFMSDRRLTGYDNVDANSPPTEPHLDEEVFLYDATSGHLVCASCNPTGARPVGVLDQEEAGEGLGLVVDRPKVWANRWLAASVPGWTAADQNRALYQSRYLSDTGRLFFNSADALVPLDTNGKEDVYQYEPPGVGGCPTSAGAGGEQPTGCLALISSGTSGNESAFLDASVSGNDVFFVTTSQLAAQDRDTSFDVYDAHVCSSAIPCLPPATSSAPACTTGESCRPAQSAQPGFGLPSTAIFSGDGNITQPAPSAKRSTNAQKLARALKACRKLPKKKRRACELQARRKYPARPAKLRRGATKTELRRASRGSIARLPR